MSDSDASLIASLMPAGALLGGLSGGFFINRFGRKGTIMYNTLIFTLSYLCLVAAQNVWMLFAGRFLCGLATGKEILSCFFKSQVSVLITPILY